jgi:predicted membrane channel-forming protein YqfA (hemolysin III family)
VDADELREKRDQELIELLNEARVALSGASVLFGFLLVVPFSARWGHTTNGQRAAYLVAFLATMLAVLGLMMPTAYHRLRWRERNKERMLRVSHFGVLGASMFLAVAMTAGVYLVIDTVLSTPWAIGVTSVVGAAFGLLWFALPLLGPYERWDEPSGEVGAGRDPGEP